MVSLSGAFTSCLNASNKTATSPSKIVEKSHKQSSSSRIVACQGDDAELGEKLSTSD